MPKRAIDRHSFLHNVCRILYPSPESIKYETVSSLREPGEMAEAGTPTKSVTAAVCGVSTASERAVSGRLESF